MEKNEQETELIKTHNNIFFKLKTEFQQFVFNVFGKIFDSENIISLYLLIFLYIIQFMQILSFSFNRFAFKEAWGGTQLAKTLCNIFSYFSFSFFFDITNWDQFMYNIFIVFQLIKRVIFYVVVAFICITLSLMIYFQYNVKNNKQIMQWPIYLLKALLKLYETLLFIPFLQILSAMLACKSNPIQNQLGSFINIYYEDTSCWQNIHILHAAFAIVCMALFLFVVLLDSFLCYELRPLTSNPDAKLNGKPFMVFLAYQATLVMFFQYALTPYTHYILISVLLIGNNWMFYFFHFKSNLYNAKVKKVLSLFSAINLWSTFVLLYSKFLQKSNINGSVVGWLLGLPLVIIVIIIHDSIQTKYILLTNTQNTNNANDLILFLQTMLQIYRTKIVDKRQESAIVGFTQVHINNCIIENCALKKKIEINARIKNQMQEIDMCEQIQDYQIVHVLQKEYQLGLKRYPEDYQLRLSYVAFLIDILKYRSTGLQELTIIEKNSTNLDHQFQARMYKKFIEDELSVSSSEMLNIDQLASITFENHLKQLHQQIEKSSMLHLDFWSHLQEDNPDLTKINDLGTKINQSILAVEEHWNKLQKIRANLPSAIRLYAKYIIEILNDRHKGYLLLIKASKIEQDLQGKKYITKIVELNSQPIPSIFVNVEPENLGGIVGLNQAMCSLLGYNKQEIIGKNITCAMTNLDALYHPGFLENYLASSGSNIFAKDRILFPKMKSGYILPVLANVKPAQSLANGIQVVASFKKDKSIRPRAYILCRKDGTIEGCTSTVISMMKLHQKLIQIKFQNINQIFPNILENVEQYRLKAGTPISLLLQRIHNSPIQLLLTITDYGYTKIKHVGYLFKFEQISETTSSSNIQSQLAEKLEKKLNTFQFKFNPANQQIIGQFTEQITGEVSSRHPFEISVLKKDQPPGHSLIGGMVDVSAFTNNYLEESHQMLEQSQHKLDQSKLATDENLGENQAMMKYYNEVQNFGAKIRVMKFVENKLDDAEYFKTQETEEDSDDEDKLKNSIFADQFEVNEEKSTWQDLSSEIETQTISAYKIQLNQIINDESRPKALILINNFIKVLFFGIIIISFIDFFISQSEYSSLKNSFSLIIKSHRRIADLNYVGSAVRELNLHNQNVYKQEDQNIQSTDQLKESISLNIKEVEQIQTELIQSSIEKHKELEKLFQHNIIPMTSANNKQENYDINQAVSTYIQAAFKVQNTELDQITMQDPNVFFVIYNILNEFEKRIVDASNYYTISLYEKVSSKGGIHLIFLVIVGFCLAASLILLKPILTTIFKLKVQILNLFLEIPEMNIRLLYQKSERFISSIQMGDEQDDIYSESNEDTNLRKKNDEIFDEENLKKKSKKKFKMTGNKQFKTIMMFFICALIVEGYFIFTFFMFKSNFKEIKNIVNEVNVTSFSESFFIQSINEQRQLIIDSNFKINGIEARNYIDKNKILDEMYEITQQIHRIHATNLQYHNTEYENAYDNIMVENSCEFIEKNLKSTNIEYCNSFAQESIKQGIAILTTRFIENYRSLADMLDRIMTNKDISIYLEGTLDQKNFTGDNINRLNMFRLNKSKEQLEAQTLFIKPTYRYIMDSLKFDIDKKFNSILTLKITLIIIFVIIVILIYLIYWIPVINRLTKDINKTRSMLGMIPYNVINKMKNVKNYVRKQIIRK